MFSTMINQATLGSYLDLPERVRVNTKPKRLVPQKRDMNSTEKADSVYINALKNGPLTVKQLAEATDKKVSTCQRQVRRMELRGLIKQSGVIKTKANPPILWGLV